MTAAISDGVLTVSIVGFLVLGAIFGYLVAVARTPALLARMSDAELAALARRVSRRRIGGLMRQYRAAPRPTPQAAPASGSDREARVAALSFIDRTRAGGEP